MFTRITNSDVEKYIEYFAERYGKPNKQLVKNGLRTQVRDVNGILTISMLGDLIRGNDCFVDTIFDKDNKRTIGRVRGFLKVNNEKKESVEKYLSNLNNNKKGRIFRIENGEVIVDTIIEYKDNIYPKKVIERTQDTMEFIKTIQIELEEINRTKEIDIPRDFGEALWNIKRYNEARVNKNLGVSKSYEDILTDSVAYKILGNYEKAQELCFEAIRKNKDMCTAYYNLGKILYIMGEYDASIRAYRKAVDRNLPTGNNILIHIGHSIMDKDEENQKKYKRSIETYRRRIDPYSFIKEGLDADDVQNLAEKEETYVEYEEKCVNKAREEFNL